MGVAQAQAVDMTQLSPGWSSYSNIDFKEEFPLIYLYTFFKKQV